MKNAELILEMNIINYEENFFLSNCNIKLFLFRTGFKFAAVFKRKNFRLIAKTAVFVKLNALKALI